MALRGKDPTKEKRGEASGESIDFDSCKEFVAYEFNCLTLVLKILQSTNTKQFPIGLLVHHGMTS